MGARILVIEDNLANMELVRYVLEAFGYQVSEALDGETGLLRARAEHPDLIVCDLQLPGIDGFAVARQLKADALLAPIPLVALTALAMVGDRERVLAGGFDGYITKPLDPQLFVPQIAAFLQRPPPLRAQQEVFEAHADMVLPEAHARALVLDDLVTNTDVLRSVLEPHGIAVEAVTNIAAALAQLAHRKPDIIISDLHVGHERGEDFYHRIKARPELRKVPFVFISSTVLHDAERLAALSAGADRFLVRPIDNALLLAEIQACLNLNQQDT
jgi:two-component system cell cycle response regulator